MTTVNWKQPEVASVGAKAGFFEPMLCLAVEKLPEGPAWQYEVKLDGYRAIGVRTRSGIELWSRNKRDFSRRFPNIAHALGAVPVETVLDGEIVAVNGDGQPSFSSLQNFGDGATAILFYVFDAPVLASADLRGKPLAIRRKMLREVIPSLPDTIRFSETFDASGAELMAAVRSNGLEGVVAKRRDSSYKPGDRCGAWVKVRANRGQEFVIGGYLPGSATFDSILVAYYKGHDLMYASRIRNGFTPASRRALFSNFEGLSISKCPFRNLPEAGKGRWGEGLTVEDMKKCRWLKPQLVAVIEFLEWARQSSPPPEVCGDTRRSERGGGHTGVIIKRCSFYGVLALPVVGCFRKASCLQDCVAIRLRSFR